MPPFYILAFKLFFFSNVFRVSHEEVKKWAESLENLISHECKYDSFPPSATPQDEDKACWIDKLFHTTLDLIGIAKRLGFFLNFRLRKISPLKISPYPRYLWYTMESSYIVHVENHLSHHIKKGQRKKLDFFQN